MARRPPKGEQALTADPRGTPGPRGRGGRTQRPIARTTGRPAKVTPTAVSQAVRLSQPELRGRLQLTEAEAKFLDACSSGRPPRNAVAGIQALKLRLDFAYEKPKQSVEIDHTFKSHAELVAEAMRQHREKQAKAKP
jgi:hypothetical protein